MIHCLIIAFLLFTDFVYGHVIDEDRLRQPKSFHQLPICRLGSDCGIIPGSVCALSIDSKCHCPIGFVLVNGTACEQWQCSDDYACNQQFGAQADESPFTCAESHSGSSKCICSADFKPDTDDVTCIARTKWSIILVIGLMAIALTLGLCYGIYACFCASSYTNPLAQFTSAGLASSATQKTTDRNVK